MSNSNIKAFWHCRNCMPAKPASISPADWTRIEIGWTQGGVQAWCRRCDMPVVTLFTPAALEVCRMVLAIYGKGYHQEPMSAEQMTEHTKQLLTLAKQAVDEVEP